MGFQYQKVKSVAKDIHTKSEALNKLVLKTMGTIADLVGATLGPGGMPVIIEPQEHGLPAMVTKDGVTVFRSIGFNNPTAHVIMDAAREAAVRTANEAGDGTTTATVLADAIVRKAHDYCRNHPKESPQRLGRKLMSVFSKVIEPLVRDLSKKADLSTDEGQRFLWNVAKISANGDTELADAVMECFNLVGDEGNVTLMEVSGPSRYEVERIDGYPIPIGYEDSTGKFQAKFINDPGNLRCVLENPAFVIYHGRITEIQQVVNLMEKIGAAWQTDQGFRHNVVLVATGFSESVLAQLALNFAEMTTINVFPLLAPLSPVPNGQLGFLQDLCAYTGATLLDPLNRPFDAAQLEDLGCLARTFESNRFKSTIIAETDENGELSNEDAALNIEGQVQTLKKQMNQAASQLDKSYLEERIGKLTGGIARLKVVGSSNGELRERRDRAEDAVCAVRGAIKHGFLPGGGWTLLKLADELLKLNDPQVSQVLCPALLAPVQRLFHNCGYTEGESQSHIEAVCKRIVSKETPLVFDAMEGKLVDPYEGGVLDSTPAVLEAIRNSLSIAHLLGTLGGAVVFKRDLELERTEARDTASFLRDAEYAENPADERP